MLFLSIAYLASKAHCQTFTDVITLGKKAHKLFPTTQSQSQSLKDILTAITLCTISMRSQKDIQRFNAYPGPFLNPVMR